MFTFVTCKQGPRHQQEERAESSHGESVFWVRGMFNSISEYIETRLAGDVCMYEATGSILDIPVSVFLQLTLCSDPNSCVLTSKTCDSSSW